MRSLSLLFGALLAGCSTSHPLTRATPNFWAMAALHQRLLDLAATPAAPYVPVEAPPAAAAASPERTTPPEPSATPFAPEPGVPFDVWLALLKQSAPRTQTAVAAPATKPEPARPDEPAVTDERSEPQAPNGHEAARQAASDEAARLRFEALASVYGAGRGFTGIGAGNGYTGIGAGNGYTGIGAGNGYTGVGAGNGFTGITASPVATGAPLREGALVWTPYGLVPVVER
jgi:hypothetical protein